MKLSPRATEFVYDPGTPHSVLMLISDLEKQQSPRLKAPETSGDSPLSQPPRPISFWVLLYHLLSVHVHPLSSLPWTFAITTLQPPSPSSCPSRIYYALCSWSDFFLLVGKSTQNPTKISHIFIVKPDPVAWRSNPFMG